MHFDRSKSFKVTDFCTNEKLIYDFPAVINCGLSSISHYFQDRELQSKTQHPTLIRTPNLVIKIITLKVDIWKPHDKSKEIFSTM